MPDRQSNSMEAAVRTFFSSPRFAVAGASSDPAKFGHKGVLQFVPASDQKPGLRASRGLSSQLARNITLNSFVECSIRMVSPAQPPRNTNKSFHTLHNHTLRQTYSSSTHGLKHIKLLHYSPLSFLAPAQALRLLPLRHHTTQDHT